jgi:hypothetical protein
MLFGALLLLTPIPQVIGPASAVTPSASVLIASAARPVEAPKELPAAPAPKVEADADASSAESIPPAPAMADAATQPVAAPEILDVMLPAPSSPAFLAAAKPAFIRPYETPTQRKTWYALAVVSHGAAVFDAWSTRRAITSGYGHEANPLLRPFAHSGALYAATQVSPALMDYLGKRMMTSRHEWVRKMWWLPQAAGSSFSFAAGVHNVGMVP